MSSRGYERDYEAIADAREDARAEKYLHRMDMQHGRVEDWRQPEPEPEP